MDKIFKKSKSLSRLFPFKEMLIDNSDVFIYGNHHNHFNAANLSENQFLYQIHKNSLELEKVNGKSEFFSYPLVNQIHVITNLQI